MKRASRWNTLLMAVSVSQFNSNVDQIVTGQSNKTLSNGFVKEIIDRNCTLTVEDKSFNILQLINLAQSTTLANNSVQLDHLNKNSNLFYFENIMFEKYPDKSTITDWLIIKPEEKEGPNYWLRLQIQTFLFLW
jgi:hypothetical protein